MGEKDDIRNRLFKVISDFSGPQIEEPLPSLEQWEHEPNSSEIRKHPRKDVPVYGIFETSNSKFRASTKNVSEGGVLIEPEIDLSLYEFISMTFVHEKLNAPIQTKGKVIRVDSRGVGIQFDRVVSVMSSL